MSGIVCVLGCGPAGLLAAEAARQEGYRVSVFSVKQKSRTLGAQYIHEPIPGVTPSEPDGKVRFTYWGDSAVYARKVYGDPGAETSWGSFGGLMDAWSMTTVYDVLWELWEPHIKDKPVKPEEIGLALGVFDHVISTIPLPTICRAGHSFPYAHVWASARARREAFDNEIIYNGLPGDDWYRSSWLFGMGSTEWPGSCYDPASAGNASAGRDGALVPLRKPLRNDCDCNSRLIRAGRFGRWEKGVLAHHAYYETREALRALH